MRWVPEMTVNHAISNKGRTLTIADDRRPWGRRDRWRWAAGLPLPRIGVSSWKVHIDESFRNHGILQVGVCDAAARCGWGLCLCSGKLYRDSRDANGFLYYAPPYNAPPPDGFPDGDGTNVMTDEAGQGLHLRGRAIGLVIEVLVDHNAGTLGFRINDGPPLNALGGFPRGAVLHPYAGRILGTDRVSFEAPYLQRCHAIQAGAA